ncbi:MAG: prepilin-type N-terminal cleavage/methylation domain-containing protein [Verrucomicrobiia bacterium]
MSKFLGSKKSGFTLMELMLAIGIGGIILAGAAASLNLWARSAVSIGNYADMSGSCRRSLDVFASDVRMADDVSVSSSGTFTFTAYDASNNKVTVNYTFDNAADELVRTYDGTSTILLSNVNQFALSYFDLTRNSTTNALSVKEVQIEAILLKKTLNLSNTDEIISARFILRNRRVSN